MFLIGLTGNIGTGKSTVSNYLRQKNIPVIDSDQIARSIVEPNKKCWHKIREHFGDEAIDPTNGQINRQYLANIIFNNPNERQILNRITHPEIQKQILLKTIYYWLTFHSLIIYDIPLLFEAKVYEKWMNYIIVVRCDENEQLKRIKLRNGYNDDEAKSRINSQMSLDVKCKLANFIVDNNGTIDETKRKIDAIFNHLKKPWTFYLLRSLLIAFYSLSIFALIKFGQFTYSKLF